MDTYITHYPVKEHKKIKGLFYLQSLKWAPKDDCTPPCQLLTASQISFGTGKRKFYFLNEVASVLQNNSKRRVKICTAMIKHPNEWTHN